MVIRTEGRAIIFGITRYPGVVILMMYKIRVYNTRSVKKELQPGSIWFPVTICPVHRLDNLCSGKDF